MNPSCALLASLFLSASVLMASYPVNELPQSSISIGPPPTNATEDFGTPAWTALARGDYTQAINQGRRAIDAGKSNTEIYAILGAAYFDSGNKQDAERYLRQCLHLTGDDDSFKQTARLFLLQILGETFRINPGSVDRVAMLGLTNDFLRSDKIPIVQDAYYEDIRKWAATIPQALRSIVGTWTDASDSESLGAVFKQTEYRIVENADGGFDLTSKTITGTDAMVFTLFGKMTMVNGTLKGSLEQALVSSKALNMGLARQPISVELMLADDITSLYGTASYGKVRSSGNWGDVASGLLGTRTGQRKIRLVRSH